MRRFGFIIPLLLMLVPVVILTVFSLVQFAMVENGFALHSGRDKKLFYLAEAGLNMAWYSFAAGNFTLVTHQSDGTTPVSGTALMPVTIPGVVYDSATGWYQWQWLPGDPPDQSYTGEGIGEKFRFQVYFPSGTDPTLFHLACQATLANHTETHLVQGFATSAFQYALYSNGDASDLCRDGKVQGLVQINGNAWFCPPSSVTLQSDLIQLGGDAYRFEDAWDRPDDGAQVLIAKGRQAGPLVQMTGGAQTQALDAFNPAWTDTGAGGAIQTFGGVLVDQSLGGRGPRTASPAFQPGGFYDTQAGLHVSAGMVKPWLSSESLLNRDTNLPETVDEIDIRGLAMSSDWPSNGVLYASVPISIVHGEKLAGPLTIASDCEIYVHGSYNRNFTNLVNQLLYLLLGVSERQQASIMTSDRVFFLSDAWNDAASFGGGAEDGAVHPLFLGDFNALLVQIWELNAAFVDGAPAVDKLAWVPSWQGVANPSWHPNGDPHTDGFMETGLAGIQVIKYGSIGHLSNATMAAFDNSNAGPGITPWIVQSAYTDPQRDYRWDPGLKPPVPLNVGTRALWQRSTP